MADFLFDINHRKTRSSIDDQNKKRVTNHYISIYFNMAETICPEQIEKKVKAVVEGVTNSDLGKEKEEPNFEAQNRPRSRSPLSRKPASTFYIKRFRVLTSTGPYRNCAVLLENLIF